MGAIRNLKLGLLGASRALGGFERVRRSEWRRGRLLILCYHGISLEREHEWDGALYMPADLLRARLETIRRSGAAVLPLGKAVEALAAGELREPAVALTFDDGFCDFHRMAAPLLREFEYPATVYLTTYYVDRQLPLFNLICPYMLWLKRDSGRVIGAGLWEGAPERVSPDTWRNLETRIREQAQARGLSTVEKDELAAKLAGHLGIDYEAVRASRALSLMNAEEVRELAGQGFDFQLHTHRHRTPSDEASFLKEIRDNRERIEELTGRPAVHFCYPSGVHRPEMLAWLRREGVVTATTCEGGLCRRGAEPLLLPRKIDTCLVTQTELEGWISGFEPWVRFKG